jgi:hypothetical protein
VNIFVNISSVFFNVGNVQATVIASAVAQAVLCLITGGRSGFDPRQGQRIFLLALASRPALGPTQPPIQQVPGILSPGVKRGRGVLLTTNPHIVPRSRISISYTSSPPPPQTPSWRVARQLTLPL